MEYDLSLGMLKLFNTLLVFFLALSLDAKSVMDFNFIQKGKENNNTLLIIGGIQGDEPGGFMAASLLCSHYEITKGSLWIVPNLNFLSIIERSRGPYGDMNRKFAKLSKQDPEFDTIQRIKNYIKDERVKLIVNLHDGSGYYRHKYIDKNHSPYKWGQCSIIDQSEIATRKYGNLEEISHAVVAHVNENLLKKEDKYHLHNTRTKEGDREMEKSLTYFAINQGKAAFGNEASKNLATHKRVYYHLLALEKYMDIMGIEYKRKFSMSSQGVYGAINNDIYISLYDKKITLPLSKVRNSLKYFPIQKDGIVDFQGSNPLVAIIKKGNTYVVHYGNRRLSYLKADYIEYERGTPTVKVEVDGELKDYNFGDIVDVQTEFVIKNDKKFRVNVIGFTNRSKIETDIPIEKGQMLKRYSVDTKGKIYRVEYYSKKKFAGMLLVHFKS